MSEHAYARRPEQLSLDLATTIDHNELVHPNQVGTVIYWEKRNILSGEKHVWHKIQPDLAQEDLRRFLVGLSGKADTFFSVNEFHHWHLIRLLKSLRACYVDIDLGRPADRHDMNEALEILAGQGLPSPGLVVFSGHGLHFYWLIKPTPASALPVWQMVENVLVDALSDFHADKKAKNCNRVLRLAGTLNTKGLDYKEVRGLVLDGHPWTFHQLANEVLGYRPDKPSASVRSIEAARAKRKIPLPPGLHPISKVYPGRLNLLKRWHRVLEDLHTIGRHHSLIPDGHRNEFLFISSVALSWFASPDSIEREVVDMYRLYCKSPGIDEEEARRAASQSITRARVARGDDEKLKARYIFNGKIRDARYKFGRMKLWEKLEEIASPVKDMLHGIITDEMAAQREKARQAGRDRVAEGRYSSRNTGKGIRESNLEKAELARAFRAQGGEIRHIAQALEVSQRTIIRWLSSK